MALLTCALELWTNCSWPTCVTTVGTLNLSEVLVPGFEESERKISEAYRKVFAWARLALPCVAPHGVGDVRLVCRERVLSDVVWPCGCRLHSACLTEELRVEVVCGCSECRQFCVYCGELLHEPVPCTQMMELRKALEELHVEYVTNSR